MMRLLTGQRIYQVVAVLVTLTGLSVLAAISMARTDGQLFYTLDDPYIHLAVAESILRGGYGVNLSEFSAPSSSILYPYLLAGALWLGLGDWSPMVLVVFGAVLTAWLMAGAFWRYAVAPQSWRSIAFAAVVLVPMLMAVNVLALPMTGMEHMLHTALTVAAVIGLFELSRDRPLPLWFLAVLIVLPLIRYEGLALVLPAILALLWRRKFVGAAVVVAVLTAAMGGFAWVLVQNGVPILPSSVMVKSKLIADTLDAGAKDTPVLDLVVAFGDRALGSFGNRYGTILGAGMAMLTLALTTRRPGDSNRVILWLCVCLALLGHILIGHFGWFSRYEIYAMAMMITALILVYSDFWRALDARFFFKTVGAVGLLALLAGDYLLTVLRTPAASHNIYVQQYQMHRFAVDYFPHTVAVNDLGYVAYGNDNFVLDLWGLGSEEARLATRGKNRRSQAVLDELANRRDASYAMIYAEWYKQGLPQSWCRIATLKTVKVTASKADVAIYLIDPALRDEMNAALDAFAPTLPEPDTIVRFPCPAT